ncbi:capsule biosynthesis protein [Pseudorhodoplanes sp.]|uniref:capsule biosynthesis protein n=1 Tax=Pseudorhodoplanes sp. TaxID=1934341 RepID=UPI003D13D695
MLLAIVIIPTFIAAIYFGLIASDRYVSEATFIVRGASQQSSSGITSMLRSFGLSRADDDTRAVQDYMLSRVAVRQLDARHPLREIYSRSGTDWFTRFPSFWRKNTDEALYDYYISRVTILYNQSTGITSLRVSAFTPEDAQTLARTLLSLSEELVNRLNARAQGDAIEHARSEVARAESKVIASQSAITTFRNRELIFDPSSNSAKSLEIVGKLASELARTRTQLDETQTAAPSNPSIQGLRIRSAALQEQIRLEQSKLAGGNDALASKMSDYERLVLGREFADRELTLAAGALEVARQQARKQHIYIETIASPHLSDESTEPRRWRGFFTVLIFSLALFCIAWFLYVGAKEQLHG